MQPKPRHLGPEYAAQFQDSAIVTAYKFRPPYPRDIFDQITKLAPQASVILDIGCGTGAVARVLASNSTRVDAVDCSSGMLAEGRKLPNGNHANLRWICGCAETVELHPPYDVQLQLQVSIG